MNGGQADIPCPHTVASRRLQEIKESENDFSREIPDCVRWSIWVITNSKRSRFVPCSGPICGCPPHHACPHVSIECGYLDLNAEPSLGSGVALLQRSSLGELCTSGASALDLKDAL